MITVQQMIERSSLYRRLNSNPARRKMRSDWVRTEPLDVIVIGAGIGGLATAAKLARAGFQVTVIEKSAKPGGRVHQLERDGFTFDTGATMYLMPGIFEQFYADLGQRVEDHLDLIRVDPSCRIHFDDGQSLDLTGDMQQLYSQLEAIEPGSFANAMRYLGEASQTMAVGLNEFLGRDFRSIFDYFSPKNIPFFLKSKAYIKHYSHVASYFKDEHLRQAFTFHNMYLGLSPFDAPATYSALQFTELVEGVYFPRRGMYQVVESLLNIGQKLGVRYLFNAPVTSINLKDGRASGVTLENKQTLDADLIVANADLPYVYDTLLPDEREAARLKQLKYTCSELIFCWGLKKKYPQLLQHNLFMTGDYRSSFDRIFKDLTLPEDPSFYLNVPSRGDPGLAPPDKDGLMVMVPVGHLDDRRIQDWKLLRDKAREAVFTRLSAIGIDDLRQNIVSEATFGPQEYRSHLNLMKGAAFGLAYHFNQIGYLRPHNQHHRYRNLYFVGASTHPGGGIPMVLISARLVTDRILNDFAHSAERVKAFAHVLAT